VRKLPRILPMLVPAAGLVFLVPVPAAAQLTQPGVSLELARHRAATLSDIRYDVSFRLPAARTENVHGTVEIRFHRNDHGPVILDFADPARALAVRANGAPTELEAVHNHIVIPAAALVVGENTVRVDFIAGDAPLNRHDDFLYTLFVPDRAHEVLPVFDQPDLKARFRLRLAVPRDWEAVANGALAERLPQGDDVVAFRFEETEPLPTYLFSFAAGVFAIEEAERDGRAMRLFHRETDPESLARNLTDIFDLHATSLAWLEDYTGIPYPFGKFDFVAIPSFQYNGMEHPGAILYRASSLFLDESATRNEELGRASLIAHETAHMWFGDLVTMTWFDDVWMKEVFANFMAAKIVNPSFPDIDHDLRFLVAHYPAAYGVDRTAGANPIRQELDNLDDAASLYGAIIYQKAPIVMRQLERLTGEAAFQEAVRRYLDRYAFGNASWTDLVALLDEATPLDVPTWSRVWIEEPGRPTIQVEREGEGVRLWQEDPRGRGLVWDQGTVVRAYSHGDWVERSIVLGREPAHVPLPRALLDAGTPVFPNGAGLGYGLFILDPVTRDGLLRSLADAPDPLARAAGWIALHEMMIEGLVRPDELARLATDLVAIEEDELVVQLVLGDLVPLFWRWVPTEVRDALAAEIETLLWNRMETVDRPSTKAAYVNAWRAVASTPAAIRRMDRLWRGDLEVQGLTLSERDLTTLALHLAVRGAPDAGAILDEQAARIDNPDRRARFAFIREAADPDPAVRDAFFAGLARPENRSREEWVVTALQFLNHPLRADHARRHLRAALDLLLEVRDTGDIFFPARWLDATLGGHASPEAAAIVREFIAGQEDYPPRLMGKVLQSADPLFRAAAAR
jgi:aminopeptidase N